MSRTYRVYSIHNIFNILSQAKLRILDISFNNINGGSFAVSAVKESSNFSTNSSLVGWHLTNEVNFGINSPRIFREFEHNIFTHRSSLISLLSTLKSQGKKIAGYGASTKGNVLLQFCNIYDNFLDYIVDVNPEKNGCFTPGTQIPIVGEECLKDNMPDYFLVLPWHFKEHILKREVKLIERGVKFIFPFPHIEII